MFFRLNWDELKIKNLFSEILSVKANSLLNDIAISLTTFDRKVLCQFLLSALMYFSTSINPCSRGYLLPCFQGRPKILETRLECHFVATSCPSIFQMTSIVRNRGEKWQNVHRAKKRRDKYCVGSQRPQYSASIYWPFQFCTFEVISKTLKLRISRRNPLKLNLTDM